jgi:predicted ATP-dependent serine protease
MFGMRPTDPIHVHGGKLTGFRGTMAALRDYIVEHDIKLVILDTLSRFWSDIIGEESDNIQVGRTVDPFLELARDTNVVVLLVHHERKAGGDEGRGIRGGSALFGLVDQALLLERKHGTDRTLRTLKALGRYSEAKSYSCWITRRGCTLAWNPNQASPVGAGGKRRHPRAHEDTGVGADEPEA